MDDPEVADASGLSPGQRRRAALIAAAAAVDVDEARMFLAMLGLDDTPPPEGA